MSESSLGQFFDGLSREYAAAIERCVPRYREMLWTLLDYLPAAGPYQRVLELGSGTGNLSVLLAARFPEAEMTFVDLSEESLRECRQRLVQAGADSRFHFLTADMRALEWEAGRFDLIVSSISIHHLTSLEKQQLFRQTRTWLRPAGVFSFADQFSGATAEIYARHMHHWREQSLAAGSTPAEFAMWLEHQRQYDFHDSLPEQLAWLAAAGLVDVDCTWRHLLWTIVQARSPG